MIQLGRRRAIVAARTKAEKLSTVEPGGCAPPFVVVEAEAPKGRAMCPKCGIKPNHFFHVKYCKGTE